MLKDYWIFLEYNNVKRDGNNVDGAIKTPVNEESVSYTHLDVYKRQPEVWRLCRILCHKRY